MKQSFGVTQLSWALTLGSKRCNLRENVVVPAKTEAILLCAWAKQHELALKWTDKSTLVNAIGVRNPEVALECFMNEFLEPCALWVSQVPIYWFTCAQAHDIHFFLRPITLRPEDWYLDWSCNRVYNKIEIFRQNYKLYSYPPTNRYR